MAFRSPITGTPPPKNIKWADTRALLRVICNRTTSDPLQKHKPVPCECNNVFFKWEAPLCRQPLNSEIEKTDPKKSEREPEYTNSQLPYCQTPSDFVW
jgi:hypothetical protein